MKVILLQDVAKIGRRFEIVEVPNGLAQNKLIPQKLATEATDGNVKRVMARNEKLQAQSAADEEGFANAIEAASAIVIDAPIKTVGSHTITLAHGAISKEISLLVSAA